MSSRSHVFFAHKVGVKLPQHISEMLVTSFEAEVLENAEGTAYNIEDVKWYPSHNTDVGELYSFLRSLERSSFIVIDACYDYPESNENDAGEWFDNPWNAHKHVRVSIEFD
jgi:hypothetical protein